MAPVKPRAPYDLTAFTGVAFWAMATPGTAATLRLKMVMYVTTQVEDGGSCDESALGANTCGDEWGVSVALPSDGTWKAVTVRFSDINQEGWGHAFPWNPADVLGIQLQSAAATGLYDFWIDDLYLLR